MRKIAIILFIALLAACTSIDCPVQNAVYTVYSLKKADGTPDTLKTDTLWVWTPRANSLGASSDDVFDINDTEIGRAHV